MTENKILEVFVRVQEQEYYDRIMLLVGAKFAEIVKIFETIKDDMKSGKITRVSASPRFSWLMRKKREEVATVSYGEENPPKTRHIPKIIPGPPQRLTKLTTRNGIIPTTIILPRPIQMLKFCCTKVHSHISKNFLPYT